MSHHLLLYEYDPADILERRAPFREAHLAAIAHEHDAGRLVLAGAYGDPPCGGAFVFRDVESAHVEAFVQADPYVQGGVVLNWRVEPYAIVAGPDASGASR